MNNGASCAARTKYLSSCKEYDLDSDDCNECETGFWKDSINFLCVANPQGIRGCTRY